MSVRGRDVARENQLRIHVGSEVTLVSVEDAALALATVAHLGVCDRHASILGDTAANAGATAAVRVGLEVLFAQLRQHREHIGQRRPRGVSTEFVADPALETVDLCDEFLDRSGLLFRVVPVDVESALRAARGERRRADLGCELLRFAARERRGALEQFARCMAEQIEGVLDATRTRERTRVDRKSHGLRQLLEVEAACLLRELDGPLEQPTVHVVRDHALSKSLQRALRKRRVFLVVGQRPEHHAPACIDDHVLDGLRVRAARVRLQQHGHRELRRRHRLLPLVGRAVHRRKFVLKPAVEELQPMLAQKPEQLLRAHQPLQKVRLTPADFTRRIPPRYAHHRLHAPSPDGRHARADHDAPTSVDPRFASDRNDHAIERIGDLDIRR